MYCFVTFTLPASADVGRIGILRPMQSVEAAVNRFSADPIDWAERGLVPDVLVRAAIRRLCAQRLAGIGADDPVKSARMAESFVASLRASEIAPLSRLANEQHYEVPADFFTRVLGPNLKYSCGWWPEGVTELAAAEALALAETTRRAGIDNGQRVLELGCGWGSLTLWMAKRFPHSEIVGLSNSHSQRQHILTRARSQGLDNVSVITADMNRFEATGRFDRIVSVEMFEHMRNWPGLFSHVRDWLTPGGRFFMHVFCHRSTPYAFIDDEATDWMSRHFFSGGMMPSEDLPMRFQQDLRLLHRWRWDGTHYKKTANAWLRNLDARRTDVMPVLVATYGPERAALWLQRWRMFFMACAELFGYRGGREWFVAHYLFEPTPR